MVRPVALTNRQYAMARDRVRIAGSGIITTLFLTCGTRAACVTLQDRLAKDVCRVAHTFLGAEQDWGVAGFVKSTETISTTTSGAMDHVRSLPFQEAVLRCYASQTAASGSET